MGEDACRVRSGPAPQALAALRNASLFLLCAAGRTNVAAALRRYAAKPYEAPALIRASPENCTALVASAGRLAAPGPFVVHYETVLTEFVAGAVA